MKWENITVRNNDYIKVESIKVTIPLFENTQLHITDDFEFISSDPELIHFALNSNAILSSLDFNDCAQYLKKLLLRKKNKVTNIDKVTKYFQSNLILSLEKISIY